MCQHNCHMDEDMGVRVRLQPCYMCSGLKTPEQSCHLCHGEGAYERVCDCEVSESSEDWELV